MESVAFRLRDMIREICQGEGVDIIKGHVSKDHVHLFVSLPPQVTIIRLVQRLKGKTSFNLLNELEKHTGADIFGRGATFVAAAAMLRMK